MGPHIFHYSANVNSFIQIQHVMKADLDLALVECLTVTVLLHTEEVIILFTIHVRSFMATLNNFTRFLTLQPFVELQCFFVQFIVMQTLF